MGDTVANHNKLIVNDGSAHIAYSEADICRPVPKPQCTPFIYVNKSEGKISTGSYNATQTRIKGYLIHLVGGTIGKPGDEVAELGIHPSNPIGCKSGVPYRQYAITLEGSPDAYVEKRKVVRTDDPTICNAMNCDGVIKGASDDPNTLTEGMFRDEKCSMVKLTGKSGERALEWRGEDEEGDPDYIEIIEGETVDFSVDWECVSDPSRGKDPTCVIEPSNHPLWTAKASSKSYGGIVQQANQQGQHEEEEKGGVKEFTVAAPFNDVDFNSGSTGVGIPGGSVNAGAVRTLNKLASFYALYEYKKHPKRTSVVVAGCGAGKRATVVTYPKPKIEADFTFDTDVGVRLPGALGSLQKKLEWVVHVADMYTRLNSVVGGTEGFEVKVLNGFTIGVEGQFQHCNKTQRTPYDNFVRPAHCGLVHAFKASGTLLEVTGRIEVPLLTAVGGVLGRIVAWILKRAKFLGDAFFYFEAAASLTLEGAIDVDQHDERTARGTVVAQLGLTAGIAVQVASYTADASAALEGQVSGSFEVPEQDGVIMKLKASYQLETVISIKLVEGEDHEIYNKTFKPSQLRTDGDFGSLEWTAQEMKG